MGCKATEDGGRRRQGCQGARGREAQGHHSREGCRATVRQKGPSDSQKTRKGEVLGVRQKYPTGQGPGWNSKQADTNGNEGYRWDAKTSQILWPDGTLTRPPAAMAAEAERLKDEQAVQVAVDV